MSTIEPTQSTIRPTNVWGEGEYLRPVDQPTEKSAKASCPDNFKCFFSDQNCSKLMGTDFPDMCAFHTWFMARPTRFVCECGNVFYELSTNSFRHGHLFEYCKKPNSLYKDINEDNIIASNWKGTFCCPERRLHSGTTHTCGEMMVGDCCVHKHPGCTKNALCSDRTDDQFYMDT